LVIRPSGFREAAEFWEVAHDPELAFRLHALVGGTPAYKDMCGGAGRGHSRTSIAGSSAGC
jgi:uncharacterized protein